MNSLAREQRIKLHLLTSLARSQRALCRILEATADVCAESEATGEQALKQLEAISRHQRVLTEKITGIAIPRPKKGIPAQPWIRPGLHETAYPRPLKRIIERRRRKTSGLAKEEEPKAD